MLISSRELNKSLLKGVLSEKCAKFAAYTKNVRTYFRQRVLLYTDCVKLDTLLVINGIMSKTALLVCICTYHNTFQAEFLILLIHLLLGVQPYAVE